VAGAPEGSCRPLGDGADAPGPLIVPLRNQTLAGELRAEHDPRLARRRRSEALPRVLPTASLQRRHAAPREHGLPALRGARVSRTKLAAAHYGTRLVLTGATLVLGFIATPLVLGWLGAERFGAYRVLVEWLGWLTLLELGIGNSLQPLMSSALALDDRAKTSHVLRAGVRAYIGVAVAQAVALAVFVVVVPRLVPVSGPLVPDLIRAVLVSGAALLLVPVVPFRVLAEVSQRGWLVHTLLLVQGLASTGAALFCAHAGWGIAGQALAAVAGQVPLSIGLAVVGLIRFPDLAHRLFLGAVPRETWREIRRLNWPAFAVTFSGRLGLLSDNLLVGFLLGPAAVTPFQLTQRLASVAQVQLQGIGGATWAGLAEVHARGEIDLFRVRLLELTRLVAILGIAVLVPIAAWSRPFVGIWVGAENFGGELLTITAAAVALLHPVFSLWGWCFMSTGKPEPLVPVAVAVTGVNLACSVLLTLWIGLPGPVLGTIVSFVAVNAWALPLQLRRGFGVEPLPLAKAILAPLALGVPYAVLAWLLVQARPPTDWLELAVEMAALPPLFLAAAFFVVMGGDERRRYIARARYLIARSTGATA